MPGLTRSISVKRKLRADENLVVEDYEKHVADCFTCLNGPLCGKGASYARTLDEYLYSSKGKHYSKVDTQNGKDTRVKLPNEAYAVRNLLAALEKGMRLPKKVIIVQPDQALSYDENETLSYDRTYPVKARKPGRGSLSLDRPSTPTATYKIIERAPRTSRSPVSITYREPGGSPNRSTSIRGSLYNSDCEERVERVERRHKTPHQSVKYHH